MRFTMKSWACACGAAVKPVAVAIVATAIRGGSLLSSTNWHWEHPFVTGARPAGPRQNCTTCFSSVIDLSQGGALIPNRVPVLVLQ